MGLPAVPAAFLGAVLGLSGLGQAWRVASTLWGLPAVLGEGILAVAALVWASLLGLYLLRAVRERGAVLAEMQHPVHGGTPALAAVSTLLVVLAVLPYSRPLASRVRHLPPLFLDQSQ